ncbi:leucine-rich repeat domain-containing protein, partial [Flavobacterium sp. K77]|uniref:leucine-rich repeat protein n=1 Tax=Flavobacterium sp. K77 TaxID=2910676 RepID=UPI001F27BFF0
MKQKNFLLFLLLSLHFIGFAQADFSQGPLRFIQIAGTNNVGVQRDLTISPTGNLIIPSTVSNNGTTYTVTAIRNNGFRAITGIVSVFIPETVTTIDFIAFGDCPNLNSVSIPSAISGLFSTFSNCTALQTVTIRSSVPPFSSGAFNGVNLNNVKLVVPNGAEEAYRASSEWQNFGSIMPSSTVNINSNTKLTTSGNVVINVQGGALTNNGTISNINGTLTFSAPVTFAGTGTTNTRNLKIEHTGSSRLNNRINVTGSVAVNNGSLNAN